MSETGYRRESDSLGAMDVPADALYGIHTARAVENFPLAAAPAPPGPHPRLRRR